MAGDTPPASTFPPTSSYSPNLSHPQGAQQKAALDTIAKVIGTFGKIYNGFESHGEQNIPLQGPALIVFYHGLMPLDAWYFGLNFYLKTGRLVRGLGDRWLFKTPGMKRLVEAVGGVEGSPGAARRLIDEGNLVGVSPGGTREAISGTSNNYKLIWRSRTGFAKLAIETGVKIIPGFTRNVEELYRAPFVEHPLIQSLYEKTRWPIVPILGLGILPFPVKLVTYLGEAISPEPNETPDALARRTRQAIEKLIQEHQPKDQSITSAIIERFQK